MKKNLIALFLALVLLTVSFAAGAEELANDIPERVPGDFPERGIKLALTQEDLAYGINGAFSMAATEEISELPILAITYTDVPSLEAQFASFENYTQEELESEDFFFTALMALFSCNYNLYQIGLFDTDYINEKRAGDGMLGADIALADLTVLGENGGYTYLVIDNTDAHTIEDAALQERLNVAIERAKELLDTVTYQEIVFAEGEFTQTPDAIPAFETQDLAGNTVTQDIIAAKDLTVINIWGTFCNPCVEEMPELAAWSAEMPENVQLIGLVSDLNSAEDLEILETAKAICEATGADNYTHLIANEDFAELLSGVVGVPTTLLVDRNGAPVCEPIVGANVPRCQKAVNDYLSTL